MAQPFFKQVISRHCRVRQSGTPGEIQPAISVEGLRDEHPDVAFLTAAELDSKRPLIILGEPGVGKTTFINELVGNRSPVRINAALLPTGRLQPELSSKLEHVGSQAAKSPSPIVLDQLDESKDLDLVGHILEATLADKRGDAGQLIIGCRLADWPRSAELTLDRLGLEPILVELAPLSAAEVDELCRSVEVPGDELLRRASELEVSFLAGNPLTLEFLARLWRKDGTLDGDPREIFAKATRQLVEEPDSERASVQQALSYDQRLHIAGLVACYMLLGGNWALASGSSRDPLTNCLQLDALAGLSVKSVSGITMDNLKEVLATSLFSGAEGRMTFRHSSLAAHLAARHLADVEPSPAQLRSLFLVAAGDGTMGIPGALRETAAWLVARKPESMSWLAKADPSSVAGHTLLVDSPHLRRVVVESILADPVRVETTDRGWIRSSASLDHPEIAEQLRPIIAQAASSGPSDPTADAQCRLALRVALRVNTSGLTDELLSFAESRKWPGFTRAWAVEALVTDLPASAVGRLSSLARALDNHETDDQDDGLRESLLTRLYPDGMSVHEVLGLLTPRQDKNFIGLYSRYLRDFPSTVPDSDLPAVLQWARLAEGEELHDWRARVPSEIVEHLPDRVLSSENPDQHLAELARAILPLAGLRRIAIPAAIDRPPDDHDATELRRSLALAMLNESDREIGFYEVNRMWSHGRLTGRHVLLDKDDFFWALETCEAPELVCNQDVRDRLSQTAAFFLFDRTDPSHVEAVSDQRTSAVWKQLESWFEPVELDSERAAILRRRHDLELGFESNQPDDVSEWRAVVDHRLSEVRDGSLEAVENLVWELGQEPGSKHQRPAPTEVISDFAGFQLLSDSDQELVRSSLVVYLAGHDDGRGTWLGQGSRSGHSFVGGWALAQVLSDQGSLPDAVIRNLTSWLGSILCPNPTEGKPTEYRQLLFEISATNYPRELADTLGDMLRATISRSAYDSVLKEYDFNQAQELIDTIKDVVEELCQQTSEEAEAQAKSIDVATQEPSILGDALDLIVEVDATWVSNTCLTMLRPEGNNTPTLGSRAVAAQALLLHDDGSCWPKLSPILRSCGELSKVVAHNSSRKIDASTFAQAPTATVIEVLAWLGTVSSPHNDVLQSGFLPLDDGIANWRAHLLSQLASRADQESVQTLRTLAVENPDNYRIRVKLEEVRHNSRSLHRPKPTIDDLTGVLKGRQSRLVLDTDQLCDVVLEALDQIQADAPTIGEFLWDRQKVDNFDVWEPKYESSLCTFLKHELDLRIGPQSGVVTNREVVTKITEPRSGAGERVDLLVQAIDPASQTSVSVVIEVKGNWNKDVVGSLRSQLVDRYMPDVQTRAGIYLVGWFPLDQWNYPSSRRATAARQADAGTVLTDLTAAADNAAVETGCRVEVRVLELPRPGAGSY